MMFLAAELVNKSSIFQFLCCINYLIYILHAFMFMIISGGDGRGGGGLRGTTKHKTQALKIDLPKPRRDGRNL